MLFLGSRILIHMDGAGLATVAGIDAESFGGFRHWVRMDEGARCAVAVKHLENFRADGFANAAAVAFLSIYLSYHCIFILSVSPISILIALAGHAFQVSQAKHSASGGTSSVSKVALGWGLLCSMRKTSGQMISHIPHPLHLF